MKNKLERMIMKRCILLNILCLFTLFVNAQSEKDLENAYKANNKIYKALIEKNKELKELEGQLKHKLDSINKEKDKKANEENRRIENEILKFNCLDSLALSWKSIYNSQKKGKPNQTLEAYNIVVCMINSLKEKFNKKRNEELIALDTDKVREKLLSDKHKSDFDEIVMCISDYSFIMSELVTILNNIDGNTNIEGLEETTDVNRIAYTRNLLERYLMSKSKSNGKAIREGIRKEIKETYLDVYGYK